MSDRELRTHSLKIMLTESEYEQLKADAEKRGLAIAPYLRMLAAGQREEARK